MGEIKISFPIVREKTDRLNGMLQGRFADDILKRYTYMEGSMQQSCGESIDAIREVLWDEKHTLTEISGFMKALLTFIQESADAFEDTDTSCEEVYKRFV